MTSNLFGLTNSLRVIRLEVLGQNVLVLDSCANKLEIVVNLESYRYKLLHGASELLFKEIVAHVFFAILSYWQFLKILSIYQLILNGVFCATMIFFLLTTPKIETTTQTNEEKSRSFSALS